MKTFLQRLSFITFGFGVSVLVLLFIGGVSIYELSSLRKIHAYIEQEHQTVQQLSEIRMQVQAAENNKRGYLLTGEETYLQAYLQIKQQNQASISRCQRPQIFLANKNNTGFRWTANRCSGPNGLISGAAIGRPAPGKW